MGKLREWARRRGGDEARIEGLRDLGGHSGTSWAFRYVDGGGQRDFVIRLAEQAGGERAATELLRQAPLLDSLLDRGVRVAPVRDAGSDPDLFGVAYLVVDLIEGRPLIMGPDAGPAWLDHAGRQRAYEAAAIELARIHRPDIVEGLRAWAEPRSPREEVLLWTRASERAAEPAWAVECARLAEALLAKAPEDWRAGLCHGDFQTNNILFSTDGSEPSVNGVIDWEIAHIGAVDHDLAWLLMMNDERAWHPVEQRGGVDLDAIIAHYEAAAGRRVANLSWFRALASYRIAAIAGFKIRLHRTGRKEDDAWERASSSLPFMFDRAHHWLAAA